MMLAFLISLFMLPCFLSFSQDSTARMFEDAVKSLKDSGTIIYVDSSFNFYGLVSSVSKNGKVSGFFDTTKVSLMLTQKEIRFLDKEFKRQLPFVWPSGMFMNSKILSYDSAANYRLKMMKEQNRLRYKGFFTFSRIVYFRNNSFAVFRLAEMFGISAGYDYLFFYHKRNGEWKQYMKVYVGAW